MKGLAFLLLVITVASAWFLTATAAEAQTGTGWILVAPSPFGDAPIAKWTRIRAFDTAEACEQFVSTYRDPVVELGRGRPIVGDETKMLAMLRDTLTKADPSMEGYTAAVTLWNVLTAQCFPAYQVVPR